MDEARYDTMLPLVIQVQYHFRRVNYNSYIIPTMAIIIIIIMRLLNLLNYGAILTFDSVESDSILLKEERSVR